MEAHCPFGGDYDGRSLRLNPAQTSNHADAIHERGAYHRGDIAAGSNRHPHTGTIDCDCRPAYP